MDDVAVGKARLAHLPAIPAIELAASALFSERDLPHTIRHRVTAAEDLQEARRCGRLWTASTNQDRVVGFAMADVVDGQAYLAELAVVPEFGRLGIGKRLVQSVTSWARDSGFAALRLVTFRHIPWNAPFYEKLGFCVVDLPEPGTEMAGLMEEERRAGINKANRILMLQPL